MALAQAQLLRGFRRLSTAASAAAAPPAPASEFALRSGCAWLSLHSGGGAHGGGSAGGGSAATGAVGDDGCKETLTLSVGLQDERLDEMGDPVKVSAVEPGTVVTAGEALCSVRWTGMHRSEGDELYHAVWKESHGSRTVALPFAARVEGVNDRLAQQPDHLLHPDERVWMVRVRVLVEDFQRALKDGGVIPQPAKP